MPRYTGSNMDEDLSEYLRLLEMDGGVLAEALTADQKKLVSSWKRNPKAIAQTDHFFGKGNDEITEPLRGGVNKSEVHRAIERQLGHEISIEDYKAGKTTDKYGRPVKIGSLLQKVKADPKLVQQFANDSTRQLKSQNNLTVLVTRSAAGVAGQSSGGQSWENESCKNFETGSMNYHLEDEVKHGTVVAYLMDHNRNELARATFQPYRNEVGKVVYLLNGYYGPRVQEFQDHIKDIQARLSASHEPSRSVYSIHPKVYNDNMFSKTIHPNATSDDINAALKDNQSRVRFAAATHHNVTSDHIDTALNDKSSIVRAAAATHPNATSDHINKALQDKAFKVRLSAVESPNATSEHILRTLNDKNSVVRTAAARHKNATSEIIDKALSHPDISVRVGAAQNENATTHHLDKALADDNEYVRGPAAMHKNATATQLTKALTDEYAYVRASAALNRNCTPEQLSKALKDKHVLVRVSAAGNPKCTPEHISMALQDIDPDVRQAAYSHPNAPPRKKSKQNKNFQKLNEALTLLQRAKVLMWPRDAKAIAQTDHFFGKGNDDIIEPLEGSGNKSEVHRAIERQLGHEISIEDYKSGKTTDKYGRSVKIGSLLQKIKADPKLVQQFANDSTRQLKGESNLVVLVTRSAAGVAGQASGGQSWRNESCKNFKDGSQREVLKDEVKYGTVVAYLKNKQGHELARATLQPYHNNDGHTVYRLNSYYGPKVKEFQDHVHGLEKRLSGSRGHGTIFNINNNVYNDSNINYTLHPGLSRAQLHKALDHDDMYHRGGAAMHPSARPEHLSKALNDYSSYVQYRAIENPNADSSNITQALDSDDYVVRKKAVNHPNANSDHLTWGLRDEHDVVRRIAVANPRANSAHLYRGLKDHDVSVRIAAAKHPNAGADHIHKALDDDEDYVRKAAIQNKNVDSTHLERVLDDVYPVRRVAATHPLLTREQLQRILQDRDSDIVRAGKENPNYKKYFGDEEMQEVTESDMDDYIRLLSDDFNW